MNLDGLEIDLSSTVDRVASALRKAILNGDLNPGDPLREQVLAERLRVSRNTVREALRTLSSEGLAAYSPNRGVAVRHLNASDVDDIFQARSVLEIEAARAVATCPPSALRALAAELTAYSEAAASGDVSRTANAHIGFHTALVALIGSHRLAETERSLMQELRVMIAAIDRSSDDLPSEVEKHRRLLQLLERKDVDGAISCIRNDLEHAKAFILRRAK